MKYYSQHGQDKWLYEKFDKKTNGFFVEIGCIDGLHLSNTKFFEDLGWAGICIEPSPTNFKKMKENRNCICENIAISNYEGTSEFLDIHGYGQGLSGLIEKYHPKHKNRIEWELNHPQNKGNQTVNVKVEPLNNVLSRNNVTNIDFCTIDTEGGEYEILEAIDFDKYNIEILVVENNYHEDKNQKLLETKGYELIGNISQDQIFVKKA